MNSQFHRKKIKIFVSFLSPSIHFIKISNFITRDLKFSKNISFPNFKISKKQYIFHKILGKIERKKKQYSKPSSTNSISEHLALSTRIYPGIDVFPVEWWRAKDALKMTGTSVENDSIVESS